MCFTRTNDGHINTDNYSGLWLTAQEERRVTEGAKESDRVERVKRKYIYKNAWSLTVHSYQSSPSSDDVFFCCLNYRWICEQWGVSNIALFLCILLYGEQQEHQETEFDRWKILWLFYSFNYSVTFDLRVASSRQTWFSSTLTEC